MASSTPPMLFDLARLVASGKTLAAASRELSIPARTARGWSARAEFKAEVGRLRREVSNRVVNRLTCAASKAVAVLVELTHKDRAETVRLRAAEAILERFVAVTEHVELAERVAEMESRIGDGRNR